MKIEFHLPAKTVISFTTVIERATELQKQLEDRYAAFLADR